MRTYREIISFLLIREQLSLGWKVGFFIVCGALVYGSLMLRHLQLRSVDVPGTVIRDRGDPKDSAPVSYLTIKLDSGDTVRASATKSTDYRPGRRAIVKEVRTNFFGVRKHEFKSYIEEARRE